jgi:hypothetical protein
MLRIDSKGCMIHRVDLNHVLDIDGGVIHFHGGLVSSDSALAGAPALQAFYGRAGAYPMKPVWKTGPCEVAQDIWVKIATEALFEKILVDRVAGFANARMDFVGDRFHERRAQLRKGDGRTAGSVGHRQRRFPSIISERRPQRREWQVPSLSSRISGD